MRDERKTLSRATHEFCRDTAAGFRVYLSLFGNVNEPPWTADGINGCAMAGMTGIIAKVRRGRRSILVVVRPAS
jgi:hypothetical protein